MKFIFSKYFERFEIIYKNEILYPCLVKRKSLKTPVQGIPKALEK